MKGETGSGSSGSDIGNVNRPGSDGGGEVNRGRRVIPTAVFVTPPPSCSPTSTLSLPGTPRIQSFPVPVTKESPPARSHLPKSPTPQQPDPVFQSAPITEQLPNLQSPMTGTSPGKAPARNLEEYPARQKRPASEILNGGTHKSRRSSHSASQTPNPDNKSSEEQPPSIHIDSPIKLPDGGATHSSSIKLLANFFRVQFSPEAAIIEYHIDKHPQKCRRDRKLKRLIFNEVVTRHEEVRVGHANYKRANLMLDSPKVNQDLRRYLVDIPGVAGTKESYEFSINFKAMLVCQMIENFLNGELPVIPRDVLGGIGSVLKEESSRGMINVPVNDILVDNRGVQPVLCFQQSLKCTEQGLALCLDYSVSESLSVIEFLKKKVEGFGDCLENKQFEKQNPQVWLDVKQVLEGLKVKVTHCNTSKRFTIQGLSNEITSDIKVTVEDKWKNQLMQIGLVDYFEKKYQKKIQYLHLPCLDLVPGIGRNYLPMELCKVIEVHKHLKAKSKLDEYSRVKPMERKEKICEWMQSEILGGASLGNLGLKVESNMTKVEGQIIGRPVLKVGNPQVVNAVQIGKWALVDFTSSSTEPLNEEKYLDDLNKGCKEFGIGLEAPSVIHKPKVELLSDVSGVEKMLIEVVEAAGPQLQIIIFVLAEKHEGYRYIKWVSETKIGVITQCCLARGFNEGVPRFFKNLALKINAKLGGTNVELGNPLPGFDKEDSIMLIGAHVSHPESTNKCSSSIAAVAANIDRAMVRYAARVRLQYPRKEKILDFGQMVKELVESYKSQNKGNKPQKIIIFRQGVSDSQIDMVLNKELSNLKKAISNDDTYHPSITLIVAVKRHRTRLFIDGENNENIPRGTVVDTKIVQPNQQNFYLCSSHSGPFGTSKPTYYRVFYDTSNLTSEQVQKLVYNICFTYASCTYSVPLVPPLYYAHLAASRGQAFRHALEEEDTQGVQSNYTLESKLKDTMFFL